MGVAFVCIPFDGAGRDLFFDPPPAGSLLLSQSVVRVVNSFIYGTITYKKVILRFLKVLDSFGPGVLE